MNETMKKRLIQNINKDVQIFLISGFYFFGKLKLVDDNFLEIYDYKTKNDRLINLSQISNFNFMVDK